METKENNKNTHLFLFILGLSLSYDSLVCLIFGRYFDCACTMCTPSPACHPRRIPLRKTKVVSICRHTFSRGFCRTFYSTSEGFNSLHRYTIEFLEVYLRRHTPRARTRLYLPTCLGMDRREAPFLSLESLTRSGTRYRESTPESDRHWCSTGASIFYLFTDVYAPACNCVSCIARGRYRIHSGLCTRTLSHARHHRDPRTFYYREASHYSWWALMVQADTGYHIRPHRTHDHHMTR